MAHTDPTTATREQVENAIVTWRELRELRLIQERVANKLKADEDQYKGFVLEAFKNQKFEGMMIGGRTTGLTTKSVATVCDKEALMGYIKATGELDLLQFRLSTAAVDLRNEDGIVVPGTEYMDVYDLFDRKA